MVNIVFGNFLNTGRQSKFLIVHLTPTLPGTVQGIDKLYLEVRRYIIWMVPAHNHTVNFTNRDRIGARLVGNLFGIGNGRALALAIPLPVMESTAHRFANYAALMKGRSKMRTVIIYCSGFTRFGTKYS
jgi:hypothetical protein